jgi:hypothetical protein
MAEIATAGKGCNVRAEAVVVFTQYAEAMPSWYTSR